MTEGHERPVLFFVIVAGAVASLLTYVMYRSFVVHTIASPTKEAAERTVNALDPNGEGTIDKRPELPVWPPPSQTAPADPASNPMAGALPTRIDWPDAAPSRPAHPSR